MPVIQRRTVKWVVLLGVVAAVAFAVHRFAGEPRYEGRPLSAWLAVCAREYKNPKKSPEFDAAAIAVQKIGTNAIPYLLQWLQEGSEPWQNRLDGVIEKVAMGGRGTGRQGIEGVNKKLDLAMAGFYALDQRAARAAPELIRLMAQTNSADLSAAAGEALGAIGPPGVSALRETLGRAARKEHLVLVQRAAYLNNLGTNAAPLIPILIADTRSDDWMLACAAVSSLGRLAIEPDLSTPALINCLRSPSQAVRSRAARALGSFGRVAKMAIPALVEAQGDVSVEVRVAATNALGSIEAPTP